MSSRLNPLTLSNLKKYFVIKPSTDFSKGRSKKLFTKPRKRARKKGKR